MDFIENDKTLTVKEIEKFIEENDVYHVFDTRRRWHTNFVNHFEQMIVANHIVTYRKDGRLVGLCSWAIVDNRRRHDINKTRWTLPANISEGNIFYVDICLLREDASIFKIKSYLEKKYKAGVDQVLWFDIPNSKTFRLKFKGGVTCPRELATAV